MMILDFVDEEEAKKIHDNSFPFPDLSNKLYIFQKTAIEEGRIVAVGLVRLTTEGILITNKDVRSITRARAAREVIESLKKDCQLRNLDECHAFVKSDATVQFLLKLGFKMSKGGIPMIIHF
jgi:hypothetical protein